VDFRNNFIHHSYHKNLNSKSMKYIFLIQFLYFMFTFILLNRISFIMMILYFMFTFILLNRISFVIMIETQKL
jgi:hypothetical protein